MKQVTIIGGGLAGTLLSLYLARRGYLVAIYESRSDLRVSSQDAGRSINMALSCRGKTSLEKVGLLDEVNKIAVPMRARAIHEPSGEVHFQSFGRHDDEYINAVRRSELNALLLNHAQNNPNIQLHFNFKLQDIDFKRETLVFSNNKGELHATHYQYLIGADGANSQVRELMKSHGILAYKRNFLPHGYKELSIGQQNQVQLAKEHLHLWPRDSFLLLGNPNQDHSITGSLFLPKQGEDSFNSLDSEAKVACFFQKQFADVFDLMPDLISEFFKNPVGNLSNINCSTWYHSDKIVLIGDAAHGIVPFFGQGMNSAFEDCRIFNSLLDKFNDEWQQVLPEFFKSRKENTDAVAQMSMDNYQEIQCDIRDPKFNLKKQLEKILMQKYPSQYVSKHILVMFSNVPYKEAYELGSMQNVLLNSICENISSLDTLDWKHVEHCLLKYGKKMA